MKNSDFKIRTRRRERRKNFQKFVSEKFELRDLQVENKNDFLEAARWARKRTVVVAFADLPPSYGSPTKTTLFRDEIGLAMGHHAIARALDAVAVPVITLLNLSCDTVVIGQPFEFNNRGISGRDKFAREVSINLEKTLSLAPAQWQMWSRIS